MAFGTPGYVEEVLPREERRVSDSLWWPSGFLFPENREELWPQRHFPMRGTEEALEVDESVEEIQGLGLQYSVFVQMLREPGWKVQVPGSWSRSQHLWTDIPVFSEEVCEWHFPRVQRGYNIDQVPRPELLRPELNCPERFGFLPNGDLVFHWELAEALAEAFDLDIEALPSTVDGRCFIAARGCDEEHIYDSPVGQGTETGVLLSAREVKHVEDACAFIRSIGGRPEVYALNPGFTMFYRLDVPIFRCESGLNTYVDVPWDPVDVSFPRLAGFSFSIYDNPVTRAQPIFSTEHGNLVASREFLDTIQELCLPHSASPGLSLPIVRTP